MYNKALIVCWIAGFSFGFFNNDASAQISKISKKDLSYLTLLNDSLGQQGEKILDELLPINRLRADSLFTRQMVRGLITPFSFYYHFDSMLTAPTLYPPDSSFRIITWHYTLNDADFFQKGVIQMNTPDGKPKFFPLFDVSEYTDSPQDSIRDHKNWIGAVYYKLLEHNIEGQKVYTLIGYDENNSITTRKWIEILRFTEKGEPLFGGDFFRMPKNEHFQPGAKRFLMEYKSGARARLNFDEEENMIILDHLVSESGEPEKKYSLVPGGDYSGLSWHNGGWEWIAKLAVEMRGNGNEPRPALILNSDGSSNEEALKSQSEKNVKTKESNNKKAPKKPKEES